MDVDKKFRIGTMAIIIIGTIILFLGVIATSNSIQDENPISYQYKISQYEMPDGTLCNNTHMTYATREFYNCDNNKIYINPPTYRRIVNE
jgi:hypothetical protein